MRVNSIAVRVALIALVLGGCSASTFAQGRMNDKDVELTMKNLKEDAKHFRSSFNSAVGKSTIRKTSQEKDAKSLVERFQKQTERLLNTFKSKKKVDQELPAVLATSAQVDNFLATLPLGEVTTSHWAKVKTELGTLATEFEVKPPEPR